MQIWTKQECPCSHKGVSVYCLVLLSVSAMHWIAVSYTKSIQLYALGYTKVMYYLLLIKTNIAYNNTQISKVWGCNTSSIFMILFSRVTSPSIFVDFVQFFNTGGYTRDMLCVMAIRVCHKQSLIENSSFDVSEFHPVTYILQSTIMAVWN